MVLAGHNQGDNYQELALRAGFTSGTVPPSDPVHGCRETGGRVVGGWSKHGSRSLAASGGNDGDDDDGDGGREFIHDGLEPTFDEDDDDTNIWTTIVFY